MLPSICNKTVAVVQWHNTIRYILKVMGLIPFASILRMILRKNARGKTQTQYIELKSNISRALLQIA